jgi:hypothetical protein
MISAPGRRIYTVSALTAEVKAVLEDSFPAIWVEGELSNFKHHTSGHMYFTLKDAQAQIRGVMFRGHNRLLRFQPTDGLAVLVCGAVTVYERRGIPDHRRVRNLQWRPPARLRAAQGQAGGRGTLPRQPQSAAPASPEKDRHRHLPDGCRDPRHVDDHRAAVSVEVRSTPWLSRPARRGHRRLSGGSGGPGRPDRGPRGGSLRIWGLQ